MSLFGKVLALLNIIGAGALVWFAIQDYNKRSAWGESALRHEMALRGLPVNAKELDKEHKPLSRHYDAALVADLFGGVWGTPVKTQEEEVTQLKGQLDSAIQTAAAGGKEPETYAVARVLRPLVNSSVERDQMEAALFYFANAQGSKLLKDRHLKAFNEAKVSLSPELAKVQPQLTFEQAFQLAMRSQGGEPSTAFTNIVARQLPAAPADAAKVKFDEIYAKAIDKQLTDLNEQYKAQFAAAVVLPGEPEPIPDLQKAAVARLLFGLLLYQTEEAVTGQNASAEDQEALKGLQRGTAAYRAKLPDTPAFEKQFRRALVICGPRALTDAVMRRTAALRDMVTDVEASAVRERMQFVSDNAILLRQLRVLADVLRDESRRVRDLQGLEKSQSSVVKAQGDAVSARQADLRESLKRTKEMYESVRAKSAELLKNRQAIQQTIRDTEAGEEHVRYLEQLARKVESKKDND